MPLCLCMVLMSLTNRLDRLAFWVLLLRVCAWCSCTNDVLSGVFTCLIWLRYIRCAIMYRGEPSEMRFGYAVTVSSAAKVLLPFRYPSWSACVPLLW